MTERIDSMDDLDAMMADIDIPDDDDSQIFATTPSQPAGSNMPTILSAKSNPFEDDEDDNLSEDDDDFVPHSSVPATSTSTADIIDTINTYHAACTKPPPTNPFSRSTEQQMEIDTLAGHLNLSPIQAAPPSPLIDGLVGALPPSNAGDNSLYTILSPTPIPTKPLSGAILLHSETLDKKGSESVVKRTNKRTVTLLTDALLITKSKTTPADAATPPAPPTRAGSDTSTSDTPPNATPVTELKQFEFLHDLVLVDLSVTDMIERHVPLDLSRTSSIDESAASDPSPVKSRNPLKNLFKKTPKPAAAKKSRASFSGFNFHNKGGNSADSGDANHPATPLTPATIISSAYTTTPMQMTPADHSRSFALIAPGRSYIFICPTVDSHAVWIAILSLAITTAHERWYNRNSVTPTIGWNHLVSRTSPYTACITNDKPMLLATLTPNPDKRDTHGYTCLHYTGLFSNPTCAAHLLDQHADVNTLDLKTCRTPLFHATGKVDVGMCRLLVANGADVKVRDMKDETLVHVLIKNGEGHADAESVLRLLTSAGCELAAFDEDGNTPMHLAVLKKAPRMVVALANNGARTSVRNSITNLTPLQSACAKPAMDEMGVFDVEIMRNLLGVGACPNLPVRRGRHIRRGTVDRRGGEEDPEEGRMAALHVLLCGANKERLIIDEKRPCGEDGAPRFCVDEAYAFNLFVGVMELVRSGARVCNDRLLDVVMTPTIAEILKQAEGEWKSKVMEADEVGKFQHQLFQGAVGKEKWESDSASNACMLCEGVFDMLNRRHHCRMCGILVCGSCTSKKMTLSGAKEERICDCCFNKTKAHISDLTREAADRSRLMAKIDREMQEEGSEEEEEDRRDELFRGGAGGDGGGEVGERGGAAGANAAMAEAMQSLGERGEKLEQINDKSAQLKDAAADFKNMAATLKNQQQKKNNWLGL